MSPSAPAPDPVRHPPGALEPDGARLVRIALGFYGLVALFALGYDLFARVRGDLDLFARIRGEAGGDPGPLLGFSLPRIEHLGAGVAVGLVLVALTRVGLKAWHAVQDAAQLLSLWVGPITRKQAFVLAVLSGTAEELLFRGALWPHLGLIGTTFLFALVHVIPRRALWIYPLFAALAGLLLGLLRDSSGSVFPCILMHVTVNALNLAWLGENHARFLAKAGPPPARAHG